LHASPQSFVPLVRDRAIRDDDVNTNIERIFRKDFKTIPNSKEGQSVEEVESSPTELVARAHSGGKARPRHPIDKNEQNVMVYVVRDAEGKLVPKFADPPLVRSSTTRPTPNEQVVEDAPFDQEKMIVLKFTDNNDNISMDSYPRDYPFEAIESILQNQNDKYYDLFDHSIKREPLSTRVDSEGDKYLCNSIAHTEYPTQVHNHIIVNHHRFYQAISYEVCSNVNGRCSNSHTGHGYELKCEQTYRMHKLFSVPPNPENASKFEVIEVKFPSCCKCTHVRVAP
uniref:Spaetzle domain-containing protein n=1 Tax=Anopheles christyi TaxID=43041 RepID=A0A182KAU5_9DIPT